MLRTVRTAGETGPAMSALPALRLAETDNDGAVQRAYRQHLAAVSARLASSPDNSIQQQVKFPFCNAVSRERA